MTSPPGTPINAIPILAVALGVAATIACVVQAPQRSAGRGPVPLDPPAAEGSMAPNLTADGSGALLSWLEPRGERKVMRVARLEAAAWGSAASIVEGDRLFANWADFPSVARAGGGFLIAHWLEKSGSASYAYDVQLARSSDEASAWIRMGPAHDDATQTEHGFVSLVTEGSGVRAFWLDGREMAGEEESHGHGTGAPGAMTLRTALVTDRIGDSELLDARVCECCGTSAVWTAGGPVVVYRDRSETEVRDIAIVRRTAQGWSPPAMVHADGWEVPGCPVNGPAIAVDDGGRRLVVAWFTAAGGRPRVQAAFSPDAGAGFGPPVILDDGRPLGRVDVVSDGAGGAIVAWLAGARGDAAEVRLRRVMPDGRAGEPVTVTETTKGRAGGFPRMVLLGDSLVIAWTQDGSTTRVRAAVLPLAEMPEPSVSATVTPPPLPRARPWDGRPGSNAPDFAAVDLRGSRVALSALRGQALLVNVWATWCGPCREEMPVLARLHEKHAPRGLRIVGVSVDEAAGAGLVRRFVDEQKVPYTVLHDPEDHATELFGLSMLPGSFLFDRDGVLVWSRQGVVTKDDPELAAALEAALASTQAY